MNIFLNGEARQLTGPHTVAALLEAAGLAERRVAVEINRQIVPKSRHGTHELAEGDRVEIIQAIGGG